MPDKNTFLNSPATNRFHAEDLFFSRTDKRGVIQFANSTFLEIGGYSWEESQNAPHKIVRHPNMPRGIFELVWQELNNDRSVGGYVQNLAKDGTHYWVFAVMMPIEDGYLSVRLKPLSPMVDKIQAAYHTLRQAEWDEDRSPEDSAAAFLEFVKQQGFGTYSEFMTFALNEELNARNVEINAKEDARSATLHEMLKSVEKIEKHSHEVARIFEETKQIPHNMRLQAQRLEGRDGPIGVISGNHHEMMRSLEGAVISFSKAAEEGGTYIERACFVTQSMILMSQIIKNFGKETVAENVNKAEELAPLVQLGQTSEQFLTTALRDLTTRARGFSEMCRDIRRVMSGLEMTRIMCKIERSNLTTEADGLDETITELNRCERELTEVIVKIETNVAFILMSSNRMSERAAA